MILEPHVCLLDDDNSVRNGISRLLRAAGLQVQSCASGTALLEMPELESISCLVMDLRMPGLSVEDLVSELNNRGMNIPIIIISADDNEKSRQLARKLGAGGFFSKPVDGTALLDAIKWACNTTKLET